MAAVEYRLQLPDGSRRWVEAHGLATFVGDGDSRRAVSFDGSVQNISASRQLQETLRLEPNKLRNVLENIPFGVYIVNARYEIEYLNTALEKDFGPVAGRRCYQSEKKSIRLCG